MVHYKRYTAFFTFFYFYYYFILQSIQIFFRITTHIWFEKSDYIRFVSKSKMKTILFVVLNLLIQGTKAVDFLECDAGSFIVTSAGSFCKPCAIDTYQNSGDQSSCKTCTNCNLLGQGYLCTVEGAIASCANCPTGQYNDIINHKQPCKDCTTTCGRGKQQECIAVSGDSCIDCDAGMFQEEFGHTQADCKNCPNGKTNAPNFRSCINTCVPGKYKDSNTCKNCPSGRYSVFNDVSACEECKAGTYYIDAQTICPSCPTGQYQQQADQSNAACKTCGKGKVAADGRGIGGCKNCNAGTYQDQNPATIFSLSGQFTGNKGDCNECESPAIFDAINKPCTGCSSGKYTTSTNACINCQIGRYQDQVGQSFCKLCNPGGSGLADGYQDQLGQTSCNTCTPACLPGDTLARPCEANHDLECIGCETGKYRGSGDSCLFCAAGKGMDWSNPTTFCTDCDAGTYQPSSEKLSAVCISCLPGLTGEPGRSTQCVTKKQCSDDASITCADKFNSRFCGTEAEPCNALFCCRQPCPVNTAATSEPPYQCLCNTPGETTPELCDIGEFCTTRTSATIRTSAFCSKSSHIDIDFPHSPDCKPLKLLASGEWVADTAATSTCQCWQGEVAPFQIGYDKTSVKCTTNICTTQCVDATHCNSKYGHCVDPDYCSSFNGVAELDIQTGCRCQFPSTYLSSSTIYDGALQLNLRYRTTVSSPYSCQSGQKYCRAKLADSEKCSDIAITNCKNKVGLFKNELPDEDGGKYCGCGISGLCTEEEPYCVGAISLCSAAPGTPCNNIYGNHINPEPCACSALDSFGAAIGIPDPCGANMYCDTGVCSEAKCPTTGLCTNNHIETTEGTFHFEGYIPNAKCITEECDENSDILSCCERCHEWNEAAGRCGTSCPEFFDCKLIPSMTGFVRPPGNYRYETAGLVSWEIERFNTGKFDDVCVDGCSETNVANVETCCLAVDTCAEHHQNNLCVNTDNFADPSEVGSWDGSKQCEGHICRPEECCDFISCTCENGTPAFPPQCVNNTNVCQEVCDEGYFKINATHCFLGSVCAADEYMYQIPNLVFDTRCKLLNVCIDDVEYISANETDATVNGTGTNKICSPITLCDYDSQFQEQNYTLYTDRVCTNVTVCNTSTHFELTPATETTNRVCTELSPPCNYSAGEYIAQANNLTHDRICLSIDFADCAISEYMFQNYSETQNRICEPLKVCRTITNPTGATAAAAAAAAAPVCADDPSWWDLLYGSGTSSCNGGEAGGVVANPSWCSLSNSAYTEEVLRACPVACGVCEPDDPSKTTDSDNDGTADDADAFPNDATEWADSDGDGVGDNADTDDDGDGVLDNADAFPLDPSENTDSDNDGAGDNIDTDDDGDGVLDTENAFPLDPSESVDSDGDGVGDNADLYPDDPNNFDHFDDNPVIPVQPAIELPNFQYIDVGFTGQNVVACDGDADFIRVTWNGYHNIIETETASCSSTELREIEDFGGNGHIDTYSNMFAQPGQTRHFKCSLHCGDGKTFSVSCPSSTLASRHNLQSTLATEYISVNETIDSDRSCSNLTECDFTQQYIRILATDYTNRKCSALRECSGFEFISVNETTTSNRVCTPLSKCPVTEYAAPQNTTYFDRVCSTCEADGLTADGATCLGCMTKGNCKYDQSALVQDDASCFSEQCTTYTLNNMTFTNDSGTYDMNEIVLINDNWVRFDVIGGVEPDITVTGDVEKVYNDLNELVYLYFQVPVTVEDFDAKLNDTNFLLRQNCVVTILLEDKCVSDPLVDLCDSNYTRPGQQAIWWEIQYPPLEGGEACPGNGDPIDPYYIDCVNSDCERDCNETCASIWSDCLTVTGENVTCGEEGNRTKNCIVHSTPQNGGKECTPNLTESCVGAIQTPYCDCDGHILDSCAECNGGSILAVPRHSSGCCPIGTVQDVCGICNGTGICPNLKQQEIMERQVSHDKSVFEKYGLIVIVTLSVLVCFAGLFFLCCSADGWCNTQYEYEDIWVRRIQQWNADPKNRDKMKVTAKEINEYKEYFLNKK